ncbi:hypothetical protein P7F88_10540 [Vibrio hannami]|nr:hypothetical protein [Vibrio hannami]MDG3086527.1 hypothetical protein [Vibrio hannami]
MEQNQKSHPVNVETPIQIEKKLVQRAYLDKVTELARKTIKELFNHYPSK